MKRIQRFYGQLLRFLQNWASPIFRILILLLLILWIPVGMHNLVDFQGFRYGILRQPIPLYMAHLLVYLLPLLQALLIVCLLFTPSRGFGLLLSMCVLGVFTLYVGLVLLGVFGKKLPCDCGLLVKGIGWRWHLLLTGSYLLINAGAYLLHRSLHRRKSSRTAVAEGLSA